MNSKFSSPDFVELATYLSSYENLLDDKYLVCDMIDAANSIYAKLDKYFDIPAIKTFTEHSNSCYGYHNSAKGICITSYGLKEDCTRTLHTVLHEYRHNVQHHAACNVNKFSGNDRNLAAAFNENFRRYYSGDGSMQNFLIYYFQLVEEDANCFAFDIVSKYLATKKDPKFAVAKKVHSENINAYLSYVESAKAIFGENFRQVIAQFIMKR